jgi:polar amino acid transport system permease protein
VIAYVDLFYSAQLIYSVNYRTIPLLIVVSIWYLAMTSVLYVGQYFIERHFDRGFTLADQVNLRSRWLAFRHMS